MADLNGALQSLQQLQDDDVTVSAENTTVTVTVAYRDMAGLSGHEQASWDFVVRLDPDGGTYKITSTDRSAHVGLSGGGLKIEKKPGTTRSFSFSKQVGGGGAGTQTYDSKAWEDTIAQQVEAHGFTRAKGGLRKLFGR
ncbi:MAG: hypothetical protein QM607_10365 [Microbacterium sp.]